MTGVLRRAGSAMASPRGLAVGALVLACVGVRFAFFGSSDRIVTVDFADANGLVNGNEVRIAGIEAGSVTSIQIVHNANVTDPKAVNQFARVQLQIDSAHWPLHKGTLFAVRPKGVLSNVFVALTPGSQDAEQLDVSQPIPVSQTSSPINLDQLSNVFNPDVRESIRTQLQQGVVAFGGTGAQNGAVNFNGLLVNLDPLSADLAPVTSVLAQRTPELERLNIEFNTILIELKTEDANLRGTIENSNTLFKAIVAKQNDLRGTLDNAASVLGKLDQVFTGEQDNLVAIFQKGPGALDRTKQANDLLLPLIEAVNPHAPHLNDLLHDFVSGNGYKTKTGIDTLRVEAVLPPASSTATSCGGEPAEQTKCPAQDKVPPGTAANGSTGAAPTTAPLGDPAAPPTPLLGGLLG